MNISRTGHEAYQDIKEDCTTIGKLYPEYRKDTLSEIKVNELALRMMKLVALAWMVISIGLGVIIVPIVSAPAALIIASATIASFVFSHDLHRMYSNWCYDITHSDSAEKLFKQCTNAVKKNEAEPTLDNIKKEYETIVQSLTRDTMMTKAWKGVILRFSPLKTVLEEYLRYCMIAASAKPIESGKSLSSNVAKELKEVRPQRLNRLID